MSSTPAGDQDPVAAQGGARGMVFIEQVAGEFRFAVRSLLRAPGFSLAVIITLALCIGANTTILSTLYSMILKPLPVREPGQLVEIYSTYPKSTLPRGTAGGAQFINYRENASHLEAVAIWGFQQYSFGEDSDPERIPCARATSEIFKVLGIEPALGAFFTTEHSTPGKDKVVVLTQTLWETRFHSDPAIVGQQIKMTGEQYTVLGIAPRAAESIDSRIRAFVPIAYDLVRGGPGGTMYARIKSGVSIGTAQAQIDTLENAAYEAGTPQLRAAIDKNGFKMMLGGLRAEQTRVVKTGLFLVQAAGLLVLLIGCVNVANLLLARSNSRMGEFAIRQALGASRGALARQLLADALILSVTGGAAGLVLAWAGLRVINTYMTDIVVESGKITLDPVILAATALVSVLVALLIGLLPVWRLLSAKSRQENLSALMQAGSFRTSGSRAARAASAVLVTGQVALALIPLVGAGLLLHSFAKVLSLDSGIKADHVFMGRLGLPAATLRDQNKLWSFADLLLNKMREIPGVEKVSMTPNPFMYSGASPIQGYLVPGKNLAEGEIPPLTNVLNVMPDFFETMGIPLLEGRDFNADDKAGGKQVVIIDKALAEHAFPGRSAVGQNISLRGAPRTEADWGIVIGVVGNARLRGLEGQNAYPFAYSPANRGGVANGFSVVLRTATPRNDMVGVVRAKGREADSSLPFYMYGRLDEMIDTLLANRRGMVLLLSSLAGLALLLSAVGIYGTLAYDVSQRTREIGVRGALGATPGQIVGLIIRQGLWKAVVGLAVGLVGAFYVSRLLASYLYEMTPADPLAYVAVSLVLLLVAAVASFIPARRAAKVNPVVALRCE